MQTSRWCDSLAGCHINLCLPVIFIATFGFFYRDKTAPEELSFYISCQFTVHLSESLLSSSIWFLCCTGAEHYVNLVIGTGPSPLYGLLLSRSTWLVKEDGMKINEVQQIQEEGVYLSNTSAEEVAKNNNTQPLALLFLHTASFSILPGLNRELWTFPCKATPTPWLDWCRHISQSFPPELKDPALQNRFSSTIHTGCQ